MKATRIRLLIIALEATIEKEIWGNKDTCPLCIFFGRDPKGPKIQNINCDGCAEAVGLYPAHGANSCTTFIPPGYDRKYDVAEARSALWYFKLSNHLPSLMTDEDTDPWRQAANDAIRVQIKRLEKLAIKKEMADARTS